MEVQNNKRITKILHIELICISFVSSIIICCFSLSCFFSQSQHKTEGKITESPRAMAKLLKEAKRVKQVLSANTEIYSQVLIILIGGKIIIYTCACYTVQPASISFPCPFFVFFFTLLPSFSFSAYSFLTAWYLKLEKILIINIHIFYSLSRWKDCLKILISKLK